MEAINLRTIACGLMRSSIPSRRFGPLPIIIEPEVDELLSSFLKRTAAIYNTKAISLLEQIGCLETNLSSLNRRPERADIEILALSLRKESTDIAAMTFADAAVKALEFVTHGAPALKCHKCSADFGLRGVHGVVMRRWHVTVATNCRRCGGFLRPARHRIGAVVNDAIRDEEFCSIHRHVCRAIERGIDDSGAMAAVGRSMRALAAPIPISGKVRNVSRRMGRLPNGVRVPPPLLWQLIDMSRFRGKVREYRHWMPTSRPFAAWPPVGQIAATLGLHALAQSPATFGFLSDVNLVECEDALRIRGLLDLG
jgi:hypothetical protein